MGFWRNHRKPLKSPGMASLALQSLLAGKDDLARTAIARRVGERLSAATVDETDRQAAEALARVLATDAVERVRCALSLSVRHARHLSREIAMRIAHDVDSVACPFLEVTEVFSEEDWQQLVLTIRRSALVAVARRGAMPVSLAVSLAELGSQAVAETLVDNRAAPMNQRVAGTLIDRFPGATQVMDKLALREDIVAEIAARLTTRVSAAARARLAERYRMPDHTEVVGAEAEMAALLALARHTAPPGLAALVHTLKRDGKLSDFLLLKAAGENLLDFLGVALADRATLRLENVKGTLNQGGSHAVVELLRRAGVAEPLHESFWAALSCGRSKKEWTIH